MICQDEEVAITRDNIRLNDVGILTAELTDELTDGLTDELIAEMVVWKNM